VAWTSHGLGVIAGKKVLGRSSWRQNGREATYLCISLVARLADVPFSKTTSQLTTLEVVHTSTQP